MPYIQQKDRAKVAEAGPTSAGELNYAITMLVMKYLRRNDGIYTYKDLNDAIGALEACKLEFYRRVIVPYEDQKIKSNGDVYNG